MTRTVEIFGLYERRVALQISAEEMARRMGVSRTTYYYYEEGKQLPQRWRLPTMARALRWPVEQFAEGEAYVRDEWTG